MMTASWFTYTGPGRVSISRGTPRHAPAGYKLFRHLAPSRELLQANLPKDEYQRIFQSEVLDPLPAQSVWDQLHALHDGSEPVLLCYEKPPFTERNFCHRRMVADWFERELGKVVLEYGQEPPTGNLL